MYDIPSNRNTNENLSLYNSRIFNRLYVHWLLPLLMNDMNASWDTYLAQTFFKVPNGVSLLVSGVLFIIKHLCKHVVMKGCVAMSFIQRFSPVNGL